MPSQIELLLEAEQRGILPENKVAMLAEARKRGLIEGGKTQDEQPAAQPAEGILSRAAKNLPSSAMQFAKDVTAPIHSPIQTAKGIGAVVEGTVQKSIKDRWRAQGFEIDKDASEQASEAMANFITDRYGGVENIKETIAEDPVGFLADAAMVLTGGAGAIAKGAGIAGKAGRAASVAGQVGKAAKKAGAAVRAIDPASIVGKLGSRVASVAGQVGKVSEKVGAVGRAIEPASVMGKLGSRVATQVAKGGGKAISEVLGITTGASPTPIKIAYRSGKAGGEKGEMFVKSMRNQIPMDEVVEEARLAVGEMHQRKMEAYRTGISKSFQDTSETPISFKEVRDKVDKSLAGGAFKGRDISKSTAKTREAIKAQLDEWEALDPKEFHTVEGMDALRKSIGDVLDSTEYGSPARKVANQSYFVIRKAIEDQAPGYGKVLEEYHLASKHLKDLEQSLSLGNKSGTETALRKLQAVMRDDVTSAYGKRAEYAEELKKAGGTGIEEKLAGQALQPYAPRGLRGYITGGLAGSAAMGAAPGMLPVALAAGSPRLVGSAAYRLGQGGRTLSRMARPMERGNLRRAAGPGYQIGRAGRVSGQEDE